MLFSLVYTSTFKMTMLPLNILCLQSKRCVGKKRGRKEKKSWYKSKAQAKRLIIFQQKRLRMVGLRLYTLPFVRAHSYCSSINGDIKKLWQIPQVSYHWKRDQPKQAEQGWAFQPEALEVFTVFMRQSWGLDFHCTSLRYSHEIQKR